MIRLPAMPFGYGHRVGVTSVIGGRVQPGSPLVGSPCDALVIPFLPSVSDFHEAAKLPGVTFCIIPLCSPYSHLAAATWFDDMPTMAIEHPEQLPDGATVLADFDRGLLFVAESPPETEELRKRAHESADIHPTYSIDSTRYDRSGIDIRVLAEVTSADDIHRALADGADGLGVVNAERIFHDAGGEITKNDAFIRAVNANPHILPLHVRFFDPFLNDGVENIKIHDPQSSLGYRGVRILEVDGTWLPRFVMGLQMLDLEQIVVVLPMITSVSEVLRMRKQLAPKWNRLGVTVETPAAAVKIKDILEVSDYIQIGLNDLTQYTMAWDRDVPNNERLPADQIVEPVADLIASVAAACAAARVPYTLGMDLRPSASLAVQVMQLGVTSISCAPSLVRPWKDIFAQLSSYC